MNRSYPQRIEAQEGIVLPHENAHPDPPHLILTPGNSERDAERILVVDDERIIRETLREYLQSRGFDCVSAGSGQEALDQLAHGEFALLIADIRMPGYTGLQLLDYVSENYRHLAVIMITAVADLQTAVNSMKIGAYDYLTKPFELESVVESVEKALARRAQLVRDDLIAKDLRKALMNQTSVLNSAMQDLQLHRDTTLEALVRALDAREHETGCHSARVQSYAVCLAERLGFEGDLLANLARGALLHDIGKIGVSDRILLKKGSLTDKEWMEIRKHPVIGFEIVSGISFLDSAAALVLYHHERFDGSGYPQGLRAEEVPLEARLFAVIDTYDAMTSDRPYRKALAPKVAREEIIRCSGTQFDPRIVKEFLRIPLSALQQIGSKYD